MLRRHPAEPRGARAALVTALLSAVLLLPQCAADAAPSFANQRPSVAYVGTEACAACHSGLAESFAAHGMARTFAPIDPDRPLADWTGSQVVVDATTGLRHQPYRDGDRFFIRESLLDERGREIHSLVREAHYALGSGINDQAYVHEANGVLRMLPLEWYTDEDRWDFAPMFEVDNQRFSRRINVRCLVCHNAVPEIRSEPAARFALPLPSGVSCERCHGPGALHVEARGAGLEPVAGGIDSTIVNPRHLPPLRQLDICAQCHLQGDAEVLRRGRTQLSFRPGARPSARLARAPLQSRQRAGGDRRFDGGRGGVSGGDPAPSRLLPGAREPRVPPARARRRGRGAPRVRARARSALRRCGGAARPGRARALRPHAGLPAIAVLGYDQALMPGW